MHEVIDTTQTREFGQDHAATIYATLASFAYAILGMWAIVAGPEYPPAGKMIVGGTVGVVGFGGFAAVGISRLIAWRRPVITVAPHGVRDIRNTLDFVPWNLVIAIGEYRSASGVRSIRLTLVPTTEVTIRRAPLAGLLRRLSPAFSCSEFISAHATMVTYDDLRKLVEAYAARYAPMVGAESRLADTP